MFIWIILIFLLIENAKLKRELTNTPVIGHKYTKYHSFLTKGHALGNRICKVNVFVN